MTKIKLAHDELVKKHDKLNLDHDELKEKHDEIIKKHDILELKHFDLVTAHDKLKSDNSSLDDKIKKLEKAKDYDTEMSEEVTPEAIEKQFKHMYDSDPELRAVLAK